MYVCRFGFREPLAFLQPRVEVPAVSELHDHVEMPRILEVGF
jgi:hypothetical protein